MSTHRVSGYMVIHNEERGIKASMASILQYVDELLIMDGGSSDNTLSIIRSQMDLDPRIRLEIVPQPPGRYPADWREPWRRNWCAQNVKHDWVLTIDGDELLDDLPEDYFRNADNSLILNTINMLNRHEYIETYHHDEPDAPLLSWYPDPHCRFFDRRRFSYNDTPMHCYLKDSQGVHAIQHSTWTEKDIWHYHAIINPDRQLDNEKDRQRMVVKPLFKPLPRHDSLMQVR